MPSRLTAALVTGLLAATLLAAQVAPSAPALLVLSKGDLTLGTVDPATLKVLARVPSGPDPHEVVASDDGRTAYITNYGGGSLNTITVVDLVARRAAPIDLGALRGPHGVVFEGGKVWFTAEGAKVVGRYDPGSKQIDLVLGTGQNGTHMIHVSNGGRRIVTSNVGAATMTIIDMTTGTGRGRGGQARSGWDETVVTVGRGAEGFDVSPDGKEIWVANAGDGTVSILDAATKTVTQTLTANVNGANRLKFTPDGRRVFVSTLGGPDVVILDASTRREVKRVRTGKGAAGIQMQPDGARAYVACTPDDYVAVIDLESLEMTGRIDAGRQPDGLAWAAPR